MLSPSAGLFRGLDAPPLAVLVLTFLGRPDSRTNQTVSSPYILLVCTGTERDSSRPPYHHVIDIVDTSIQKPTRSTNRIVWGCQKLEFSATVLSPHHSGGPMVSRTAFIVTIATLAWLGGSDAPAQAPQAPAAPLPAGQTNDPFPQPIARDEGAITVSLREFAALPDIDGEARAADDLVEAPGTRRLFVSDMRGLLYTLGADGRTVTPYSRSARSQVGRFGAIDRPRARDAELHLPSAIRASRHAGLTASSIPTRMSSNQTPAPDFTDAKPNQHARHGTARMDREESQRRAL